MRNGLPLLALLALIPQAAGAAQDVAPDPALYRCRVYLTGSDPSTRADGLKRCVRDVLVKLSGDPDLAGDSRLDAIDAAAMVQDFLYFDRMTDVPLHDEQGTRDRPFDLVGYVDPEKAAAALRDLGLAPWVAPRPVVFAFIEIERNRGRFVLTSDTLQGERQRQALVAAGEKYGLRLSLPTAEQVPAFDAAHPDPSRLPVATGPGGVLVLTGSLAWSDADGGWIGTWRTGNGAWDIRGVSFDEAFRSAMAGVAERTAPHGK